ncbi:MAG: hypothetical protein QT08_C0016G0015 [archaeon GW2011_AR17]|nr:MAG: hypothetical protein QT08_C0016G0015 [archaeon GW2011_AR17]MBS3154695.1 DUF1947 domain-containing protein [Candidatus Woesearchaeota archaeon]HIH14980.1 DUF1947 domain-containing protein [Nanoarchaeota archaeon]HIJ05323.1 DUF1947 domain-containing protein [Nanoarchaeota archaeon]
MKRVSLRSKDFNNLVAEYSYGISKKDTVEIIDDSIILVNKKPCFFYYEKKLVPTLQNLQEKDLLKKIVVDMGAVRFLVGGADLMRPGIKEIDASLKEGDFVLVVDINNKKPLMVGLALFDAEEMQALTSGKVVKNIHYVGDAIWKFI